ncbi:hypothetical protein Zmor_000702 [Zophobas morio]|uniref:Uncharacterized protein n=1 Tax=Zophobas morio TaxID=2755281 RepID=A0AA38MNQ2_9CUCU|nr:hypothetical protein Zmor_000702 [Zophobas morio]
MTATSGPYMRRFLLVAVHYLTHKMSPSNRKHARFHNLEICDDSLHNEQGHRRREKNMHDVVIRTLSFEARRTHRSFRIDALQSA